MIKPIEKVADKKEGNIFEFSIIGLFEQNSRPDLKIQIEEICENAFLPYFYEIKTFVLKSHQGLQNVTNLIEFHHNITENYKTNEYKIDNNEFYNGVNFMEKIEEYLIISKYFLKYSTPAFINFPLGSSHIIEMSRCEENMELILASLGYREKTLTKKKGDFIKYKNYPVIILMTTMESIHPAEINPADKNVPSQQQKKSDSLTIPYLFEIIGFCYENEKENLMKTLQLIQEKFSLYCKFESDVRKSRE